MGEGGEGVASARFVVGVLAAHGKRVAARLLTWGVGGLEEGVPEDVFGEGPSVEN